MTSPELQSKIALWRSKAADNTLTVEEMKEAIAALRGERHAAASQTPAARRKAAVKIIPSADDLLAELGDL